MATLKRIGPGSAFKVGAVAYGLLGLILGIFCSAFAIAGRHWHIPQHSQIFWISNVGVFAVILCPIIYGILGGVAAAIGAAIYNLVAGWVGGLEVELG